MEINRSLDMVESLANGVDPVTGEIFSADSAYNHPDIIRALFCTLDYVKNPPKRSRKTLEQRHAENLDKGLPKNFGLPWTEQLRDNLGEQYKAGAATEKLASQFERSNGSIISELMRQGLITDQQAQQLRTVS